MAGCGDVLSLEDLQTAKKHQIFEAEVITGKAGGVAGGADIETATNQVTGQVQTTLPQTLKDLGFKPASFTFATGGTLQPGDNDLAVHNPAPAGDGNYYSWGGALPKVVPAGSTPATSGGLGANAWIPRTDEILRAELASTGGSELVGLPIGNLSQAIMFVTPEQAGAPCNGVDDDAPYVIAAIQHAAPRKIPVVMNGNYLFKTDVDMVLDHIEITGSGTITHENRAFKFSGVAGGEVNTTTAINDFSATSINVADAAGFAAGDLGIIHSSTMCLSTDAGSMQLGTATGGGAPSWFGEFFNVFSVTGNTLALATPLVYSLYPITAGPNSGARTRTTVKKVTPVTGTIAGSIKFIRAGIDTAVEIKYGRGFKVSGNFDAKRLPGASLIFSYCLDCSGVNSHFKLDPDIPITFGTANPGNPDYYQFNSVKSVSSQGCGVSNCTFENTTQTYDITYDQMPSTACYMRGCTVLFARYNMATSHAGSLGCVFSANTGVNCWRGISARSREDVVMGNRIIGFRKYPLNPNTNGLTHGVSLTEGYTIGATIKDNYISGYHRNIYVNSESSRGLGFDYQRVTISGNRMSYCFNHIEVDNVAPFDKSIDSGIVIQGNQFEGHASNAITIAPYTRSPIIKDNVFLDSPSGDSYQIVAEGNCVGVEITGNSFKDSAKTVWIKAITDPALGPNSVDGAKIQCFGNTVRGNEQSDSFAYDNTKVSLGNNFQTHNLGWKYITVATATDYTLVSDTLTVALLAPQAGPFNLIGITGGVNGRELTLFNNSGANAITVKNSASIQTKTNADVVLVLNQPIRFIFMSSKWRQI